MKENEVLERNKTAWDEIADDWFGFTSLPIFAPLMKSETELNLFENIKGKKVLDIGCGSGHSLKYMGDHGAKELWGLDLSTSQVNNAKRYLKSFDYHVHLFNSPMEINPGIPTDYFDIVYSIYAFGWTVDLTKSLKLVSKYLKAGGMFVMSWDHPILNSITTEDEKMVISKSYHDVREVLLKKGGYDLKLKTWKVSSYIDGFKNAGMYLDTWIEDVDPIVFESINNDMYKHYSKDKSKLYPLSIILKAKKF